MISDIAQQIIDTKSPITLIYAFNGTGKTRLSVEYKNLTKNKDTGAHAGIYYNAFSEDLFQWNNDEEHDNENILLNIIPSSLNDFHSYIDVKNVEEKLAIYSPTYKFNFNKYGDEEKGIESVTFFVDEETEIPIKISRGEERIFIWCFFLALLEVDEWSGPQGAHIFIDDPVSSLDDQNIFLTAETILDLIEEGYDKKKRFIITTHHIGIFSILANRLTKGEKSDKYQKATLTYILKKIKGVPELVPFKKGIFLFHLHLLETLDNAIHNELFAYHVLLLRQLLENIASFLGVGRVGYILEQIGIEKDEIEQTQSMINSLSHKNIYTLESHSLKEAEEELLKKLFSAITDNYRFKY